MVFPTMVIIVIIFCHRADYALHSFSGYECEAHNNPPDFFLDVLNGDSSAVKATQGRAILLTYSYYLCHIIIL